MRYEPIVPERESLLGLVGTDEPFTGRLSLSSGTAGNVGLDRRAAAPNPCCPLGLRSLYDLGSCVSVSLGDSDFSSAAALIFSCTLSSWKASGLQA